MLPHKDSGYNTGQTDVLMRHCWGNITMANEYIQPPELFQSEAFGYSQVVKSPPGARQLAIAGQGAFDKEMRIVGAGDLAAQARQALENLRHALRAGGAGIEDLTSMRIYVVGYTSDNLADLGPALAEFLANSRPPAQTLIGVQALGMPEMLIEIEATAVVAD